MSLRGKVAEHPIRSTLKKNAPTLQIIHRKIKDSFRIAFLIYLSRNFLTKNIPAATCLGFKVFIAC